MFKYNTIAVQHVYLKIIFVSIFKMPKFFMSHFIYFFRYILLALTEFCQRKYLTFLCRILQTIVTCADTRRIIKEQNLYFMVLRTKSASLRWRRQESFCYVQGIKLCSCNTRSLHTTSTAANSRGP